MGCNYITMSGMFWQNKANCSCRSTSPGNHPCLQLESLNRWFNEITVHCCSCYIYLPSVSSCFIDEHILAEWDSCTEASADAGCLIFNDSCSSRYKFQIVDTWLATDILYYQSIAIDWRCWQVENQIVESIVSSDILTRTQLKCGPSRVNELPCWVNTETSPFCDVESSCRGSNICFRVINSTLENYSMFCIITASAVIFVNCVVFVEKSNANAIGQDCLIRHCNVDEFFASCIKAACGAKGLS